MMQFAIFFSEEREIENSVIKTLPQSHILLYKKSGKIIDNSFIIMIETTLEATL